MKFSLILASAAAAAAQLHPGYSVGEGDMMMHVGRWCEGDQSAVVAPACNTPDSVAHDFARHASNHGGWDVIEDCNYSGSGSDDDDSDSADRFCVEAPMAGEGYACHEADVDMVLTADEYGRKMVHADNSNVIGNGGCRRVQVSNAGVNIGNAYTFDAQTGHLSFCRAHPKYDGGENWNFGVDGFECVVDAEFTTNEAPRCQDEATSVAWSSCSCATTSDTNMDTVFTNDENNDSVADGCVTLGNAERPWWYSLERSFGVDEGRWGMSPCCPDEVAAEGGCEGLEEGACMGWGEEDGEPGLCVWQVHPWHPHGSKQRDGKGKCRSSVACDVGCFEEQ